MTATWKLEIHREAHERVMVLTVSGRLGSRNSDRLRQTALDTLREGFRDVVLNLDDVDYMSSAGVDALASIGVRVQEASGTVVVCGVGESVRMVLELAGLVQELAIEASVDAALERIRLSRNSSRSEAKAKPRSE